MSELSQSEQTSVQESLRSYTSLIYALQAAGFVIGLTFIAAVVMNYIRRDETVGTLYESHFRWQIRTFWFSLLWSVVGILTAWFIVGAFVLAANAIWVIYRIVKGWVALNDERPMYPQG